MSNYLNFKQDFKIDENMSRVFMLENFSLFKFNSLISGFKTTVHKKLVPIHLMQTRLLTGIRSGVPHCGRLPRQSGIWSEVGEQ